MIDSRLEAAGLPYMLTGSVAMTLYAVPRMTRDVDVVVECGIKSLARDLVVAGMPQDQATNPRFVRRYLFLSFYGNDYDPATRDKILAHLDATWSRDPG